MAEPDCRQARRTDKPTDANLQTQRHCDLPSSQNFGTTEFCLMMSPKNGSAWPVILCCRNLLIFWQQAFYVGFDQLMLTILEGGFKVEFELVKFKLYQAKSSKSSKTSTSARFHDLPPMSIGSKPPCFDLRFELTSYLKPPGGKMKPNLPIAETNQRCGWQALDITGPNWNVTQFQDVGCFFFGCFQLILIYFSSNLISAMTTATCKALAPRWYL